MAGRPRLLAAALGMLKFANVDHLMGGYSAPSSPHAYKSIKGGKSSFKRHKRAQAKKSRKR